MAGRKSLGLLLALAALLGTIHWVGDALRRSEAAARAKGELFEAVLAGNVPKLKQCLARGANPNSKDQKSVMALSWAAYNGDVPAMRVLLDAGADPNCRGGWLPALGMAARRGHTEAVKLLLQRGADPNDNGDEPGSASLFGAAQQGHTGVVRLLLQHGADPNTRNSVERGAPYRQGSTILASMRKRIGSRPSPIVDLLVKAGASAEGAR